MSGFILSPESRAKIGASKRGRQIPSDVREKMSRALLGKPKTEQHRNNIRAGTIGHIISEETKARISAAMTGKKFPNRRSPTEAERENLRLKNLGKKASVATRAKMSEIHTKIWAERPR